MTRHPELEAAIVAAPSDRDAHRVYADWLQVQGDPLGEVIALSLAAQDEPKHLRSLEDRAAHTLDKYIEAHWVPGFPLLAHRFRAWNKSAKSRSPDQLPNTPYSQILFRWGLIRSIAMAQWSRPMIDQACELLEHPDLRFIEAVSLRLTHVDDLSMLAGLHSMWTLDLQLTKVTDLSPLAELRGLEHLVLHDLGVERIDALAKLPLVHLSLKHTAVTDLRPLAGIQSLEFLNLEGTTVTDIEPLLGLPRLREVRLYGSAASQEAAGKLRKAVNGREHGPSRSRISLHPTPTVFGP